MNISAQCPSNIALVKYWGKYGRQLPRNASVSFTLQNAHTKTSMEVCERQQKGEAVSLEFYFEKQPQPAFGLKLEKFLNTLHGDFQWLRNCHLIIHSENTFPHSAGIASSASAFGALALCLCEAHRQLTGEWADEALFLQKVSFYARLGSGSACRSLFSNAAVWGQTAAVVGSSNDYAVGIETDKIFHTFHDDILLISKSEKKVSSTAGHGLMDGNPYAPIRYAQAGDNMKKLIPALQTGDLETFGTITESEALTLHALMMTSEPSFILMEPASLQAIREVRAFREETKLPVYFTLDAGPNLHLLYPDSAAPQVAAWRDEVLRPLCQNEQIVEDVVGKGGFLSYVPRA